ncbi:MAG: tetratricopeptide repeat protein [Deltaproteobacteria bacterium]|nr:tetratricopeptide repeat protein [Deltaproteobacteria bacterium]
METESGFIFILSNPSLKGLLKIGYTPKPIEEMLSELNAATDLPTPFFLERSFQLSDAEGITRKLHAALEAHRISRDKDFFHMQLQEVEQALRECCLKIGVVYALSNPGLREGLIKIGASKRDIEEVVAELNASDAAPAPFKIEACYQVVDPEIAEEKIRQALSKFQVSRKGYYQMTPDEALRLISAILQARSLGVEIDATIDTRELTADRDRIQQCTLHIESGQHTFETLMDRARAYTRLGDYERALKDYDRALSRENTSRATCMAHAERGQVHFSRGEYEMAIEDFDRAVELNSDQECVSIACFARGQARQILGKHKEAIGDYDRALQIQPDDEYASVVYIERGRAYHKLGDLNRAIQDYNTALSLNPEDEWARVAHVERGQVYYALGDYERAMSDYEKATALMRPNK